MSLGRAGTLSCFVSFVVKGHLSHYYSMYEHMCTYVTKISAFLCTGAESNPRNRVWVEQKGIALLLCRQRETHQASVSKKKLCASTPVNLIRVYSSGSKVGSLIRLGYKEVLHSPSLFSGGLYPNLNELLSPLSSFIRWFLGCFSLDQQLFTSALWNSGKSHNGWNLTYKKWGTARPPCLCGTPQSPTQFHIWV